MNKRKRKIKVIIIFLIILSILGFGLYYVLFNKKIINIGGPEIIKEYDYTLDKRDSSLMKDNFNELKGILKEDKVDYKKYSEAISKLCIIDFYTLSNKTSSNDIGCKDYIYNYDNFKNRAQATIYKYFDKKDDLPEVTSIEVIDSKIGTFEYNENSYDSYVIQLSWEYKKDLGYDNKATLEVIKVDKKLYVVSINPEVEE